MGLTLPFPGQPAQNSALASVPVLDNINAIAQAIQAFDGSQINSGSITASALATGINPNTLLRDTIQQFVQSGCVWSAVSGLAGTMSQGILYAENATAMFRVAVNGIGSHTFAASSDTYVDIDYLGNVTYTAASNNATSPSITANAVRVAIVVTGSSTISVVNQGYLALTASTIAPVVSNNTLWKFDSLGNQIYPTSSTGKLRVLQQRITTATTGSSSTLVTYNGFLGTYNFAAVAGRVYDITISDPALSVTAGTGAFDFVVYPFIAGVQVGEMHIGLPNTGSAFALYSTVPWLATSTGSVALTMMFNSDGSPTGYSMAGSNTAPASLAVNESA